MKKDQQQSWDETFASLAITIPSQDGWLEKHRSILDRSKSTPILDLGCGMGSDSLYLSEQGYEVVACDISHVALAKLQQLIPQVTIQHVDMTKGLPFDQGSFRVIIADLSLHYYSWDLTKAVVADIRRVLANDCYLLCRVNSIKDSNHGAMQGKLLEPYYYEQNGDCKRFFDRPHIEELFHDWNITYLQEQVMHRYAKPKVLWEIALWR